MCSASTALLSVPRSNHKTISDLAFPVAAVKVWNSLPSLITSLPSLLQFRKARKTELTIVRRRSPLVINSNIATITGQQPCSLLTTNELASSSIHHAPDLSSPPLASPKLVFSSGIFFRILFVSLNPLMSTDVVPCLLCELFMQFYHKFPFLLADFKSYILYILMVKFPITSILLQINWFILHSCCYHQTWLQYGHWRRKLQLCEIVLNQCYAFSKLIAYLANCPLRALFRQSLSTLLWLHF